MPGDVLKDYEDENVIANDEDDEKDDVLANDEDDNDDENNKDMPANNNYKKDENGGLEGPLGNALFFPFSNLSPST